MQYRDRYRKRSGRSVNNEGHELEDITPRKKGKVARVYGVDNHKYYECPTDRDSIELLKHAGSITSFDEREQVFAANRPAMLKLIRYSF